MSRASSTEEISLWAERCRVWASGARTREQRLMFHGLEMILSKAAVEAEQKLDIGDFPSSFAPTQS